MKTFYRRKLPHWHPDGASLFLTWRLHGSLPSQPALESKQVGSGRAFVLADRVLDRTNEGPHWLKDPRIAGIVTDVLKYGDLTLQRYDLFAYVVMCNHVHVLLTAKVDVPAITRGIKGTTAREANRILKRTGEPFWHHESFDHWVRTDFERRTIIGYIESNPVKAGLVHREQDWPWSSAVSWRKQVAER